MLQLQLLHHACAFETYNFRIWEQSRPQNVSSAEIEVTLVKMDFSLIVSRGSFCKTQLFDLIPERILHVI